MKKTINKQRLAMLFMALLVPALEALAGGANFDVTVVANPTAAGKVYAKTVTGETYEENGFESSSEALELEINVKYDEVQPNYYFLGWTKNHLNNPSSASSISSVDNPATFTITRENEDSRVIYYFQACFTRLQVKSADAEQGSASIVGNPFIVRNDDEVTLKATPKKGYKFDGWLLNDATEYCATTANYTFTVSDKTAGIYTPSFSSMSAEVLGYVDKEGVIYALYEDHAEVVGVVESALPTWNTTGKKITIVDEIEGKKVVWFADGWTSSNTFQNGGLQDISNQSGYTPVTDPATGMTTWTSTSAAASASFTTYTTTAAKDISKTPNREPFRTLRMRAEVLGFILGFFI